MRSTFGAGGAGAGGGSAGFGSSGAGGGAETTTGDGFGGGASIAGRTGGFGGGDGGGLGGFSATVGRSILSSVGRADGCLPPDMRKAAAAPTTTNTAMIASGDFDFPPVSGAAETRAV